MTKIQAPSNKNCVIDKLRHAEDTAVKTRTYGQKTIYLPKPEMTLFELFVCLKSYPSEVDKNKHTLHDECEFDEYRPLIKGDKNYICKETAECGEHRYWLTNKHTKKWRQKKLTLTQYTLPTVRIWFAKQKGWMSSDSFKELGEFPDSEHLKSDKTTNWQSSSDSWCPIERNADMETATFYLQKDFEKMKQNAFTEFHKPLSKQQEREMEWTRRLP